MSKKGKAGTPNSNPNHEPIADNQGGEPIAQKGKKPKKTY